MYYILDSFQLVLVVVCEMVVVPVVVPSTAALIIFVAGNLRLIGCVRRVRGIRVSYSKCEEILIVIPEKIGRKII